MSKSNDILINADHFHSQQYNTNEEIQHQILGKTFYGICVQRLPLQFIGFDNSIIEIECPSLRQVKVSDIILIQLNSFQFHSQTITNFPKLIIEECEQVLICRFRNNCFWKCFKLNGNEFELQSDLKQLMINLYIHWFKEYVPTVQWTLGMDLQLFNDHVHSETPFKHIMAYVVSQSSKIVNNKQFIFFNSFLGYDQFTIKSLIETLMKQKKISLDTIFEWNIPLPPIGELFCIISEKDQCSEIEVGEWVYFSDLTPRKGKESLYKFYTTKHSSIIRLNENQNAINQRLERVARQIPKEIIKTMMKKVKQNYPTNKQSQMYCSMFKKWMKEKKIRTSLTLYKQYEIHSPTNQHFIEENNSNKFNQIKMIEENDNLNILNNFNEENHQMIEENLINENQSDLISFHQNLNNVTSIEISEMKKDESTSDHHLNNSNNLNINQINHFQNDELNRNINQQNENQNKEIIEWFHSCSQQKQLPKPILLSPFGLQLIYPTIKTFSIHDILHSDLSLFQSNEIIQLNCRIVEIYPKVKDQVITYQCQCIQRSNKLTHGICQLCHCEIIQKYQIKILVKDYQSHANESLIIHFTHETISTFLSQFNNHIFQFYDSLIQKIKENHLFQLHIKPFINILQKEIIFYL